MVVIRSHHQSEVVICEHWEGGVFLAEVEAAHRGDKHVPRP